MSTAEERESPIRVFLNQVNTKGARLGLFHVQKIMDLILFHSGIQKNKDKLVKEWGSNYL